MHGYETVGCLSEFDSYIDSFCCYLYNAMSSLALLQFVLQFCVDYVNYSGQEFSHFEQYE